MQQRPLSQKQFSALRKFAMARLAMARVAFKAGKIIESKIALNEFKLAITRLRTDLTLSENTQVRLEAKISKLEQT